jgi:hypothetical protein
MSSATLTWGLLPNLALLGFVAISVADVPDENGRGAMVQMSRPRGFETEERDGRAEPPVDPSGRLSAAGCVLISVENDLFTRLASFSMDIERSETSYARNRLTQSDFTLSSRLRVVPKPSDGKAHVDGHLTGSLDGESVTQSGSVRFRVRGRSPIEAHARITLSDLTGAGEVKLGQADVNSCLSLTLTEVFLIRRRLLSGLIRRIAIRKILRELPSERVKAERELEAAVADEIEAQGDETIGLRHSLAKTLKDRFDSVAVETNSTCVVISGRVASAASIVNPDLAVSDNSIQVAVHESYLAQVVRDYLPAADDDASPLSVLLLEGGLLHSPKASPGHTIQAGATRSKCAYDTIRVHVTAKHLVLSTGVFLEEGPMIAVVEVPCQVTSLDDGNISLRPQTIIAKRTSPDEAIPETVLKEIEEIRCRLRPCRVELLDSIIDLFEADSLETRKDLATELTDRVGRPSAAVTTTPSGWIVATFSFED